MKIILFLILAAVCFTNRISAQGINNLYALRSAEKDVQNFKLNDVDLKKFRDHREISRFQNTSKPGIKNILFPRQAENSYNKIDLYSGWFEPDASTTKDTLLLKDSTYVQTYRENAYKMTASRHTAGHYAAIYGGIAGGILVLTILYLAIYNAGHK